MMAMGELGRIINILYLVKQKLLDLPILYLSRYINKTKHNIIIYYNMFVIMVSGKHGCYLCWKRLS